MTRIPCYISAPYGDDDPNVIEHNIQRAEFIGRLAVLEGRAPIVVHSSIDGVQGGDDPSARRRGMACDLAILGVLALSPSAELWELLADDAGRTDGMKEEHACWVAKVGAGVKVRTRGGTWEDWRQLAQRHDMVTGWVHLRDAPGGRAAG